MSRRAALVVTTITASVTWVVVHRRLGLVPVDAPVLSGVVMYGPKLVIAVAALALALRARLFTRTELGLTMPPWTLRRGRLGAVLLLAAIFSTGALVDTAGPVASMIASGMNHDEIVAHLFRHEYRYMFGAREPPPELADIGVRAVKSCVLAPLAEEVPYRALLVPLVLSHLSRQWTALASGVVFFLLHWLAYGAQPHPAYFLSGWAFAWAFMLVGLPGSLAAHAGENCGVLILATFAAFAST